jgi:hypothetical protein
MYGSQQLFDLKQLDETANEQLGMYQHQPSRVLVSTELFGIGIDGIGIAGIEALKDRPC